MKWLYERENHVITFFIILTLKIIGKNFIFAFLCSRKYFAKKILANKRYFTAFRIHKIHLNKHVLYFDFVFLHQLLTVGHHHRYRTV